MGNLKPHFQIAAKDRQEAFCDPPPLLVALHQFVISRVNRFSFLSSGRCEPLWGVGFSQDFSLLFLVVS